MRLLLLTILLFATSFASEWDEIDWSMVIAREEEPGFWDKVDPELRPPASDPRRSSRIRGGWEVDPNSHPYAVALLMSTATSTFRCGSSIISSRSILTAGNFPRKFRELFLIKLFQLIVRSGLKAQSLSWVLVSLNAKIFSV
jgi:hypothetical protein